MGLRWLAACTALILMTCPAQAHFLWLVVSPAERPTQVKLYFGEEARPDDPALLDSVVKAQGFVAGSRRSEPKPLTWKKDEANAAWVAELPAGTQSPILANLTYGVLSRGGQTFLLKYYAKVHPSTLPGTWQAVGDVERLPLEVVPAIEGPAAVVEVRWQGKGVKDAEVAVSGPGLEKEVKGITDDHGNFRFALAKAGTYSIRARYVENTAGELEGKAYDTIRHYSTVAMPYTPAQLSSAEHNWPSLPKAVTSFGGAVVGDYLYVYGGHYGEAHHYSREGQSGDFLRLDLRSSNSWEALPSGPKLTGLAMVEHRGMLYRVGGFTAKNGDSEKESLWSQTSFARFDPSSKTWTELAPLPSGRSSLDAAMIGDKLYVAGGWELKGDAESQWQDSALVADLSQEPIQWKAIAKPSFQRRAVALAGFQGKLYVLGGMQRQGSPTTQVAVYDPATDKWSDGPALLGGTMDGFGSSAFACNGQLFATTMSGSIQRLSGDNSQWELVGSLKQPRFFHRMLPWQDQLVIVAGAHMAIGKLDSLERVPVRPTATSAR